MHYDDLEELKNFIKFEVNITPIMTGNLEKKNYISKGKVFLVTKMKENKLPQVAFQAYFWVRMSCELKGEVPSQENILLAGPTSYNSSLDDKKN